MPHKKKTKAKANNNQTSSSSSHANNNQTRAEPATAQMSTLPPIINGATATRQPKFIQIKTASPNSTYAQLTANLLSKDPLVRFAAEESIYQSPFMNFADGVKNDNLVIGKAFIRAGWFPP